MAPPSTASNNGGSTITELVVFVHENLIAVFFALLGAGALSWLVGFNFVWSKNHVLRVLRSLGVAADRAKRAVAELRRKSFHLVGLLIPFIYYLGLRYSDGLLTRHRAQWLLGIPTTFLWIVELLRWISPSFRAHYNRLFAKIMRKQELVAPTLLDTGEQPVVSAFVHGVDQLVQTLATPILGEAPIASNGSGATTPRRGMSPSPSSTSLRRQLQQQALAQEKAAALERAAAKPLPLHVQDDYSKLTKPSAGIVPQPPLSPKPHTTPAAAAGSERIFTGTGFFFLGNWLALYLFSPTIATCGMLNLVLGDLTAALVGISVGRIKIGRKSLEGTLAMMAVCFAVGAVFFHAEPYGLLCALLAAAAATLVELLGPDRWFCDDNVTIPLATGVAYTVAFTLIGNGIPKDF